MNVNIIVMLSLVVILAITAWATHGMQGLADGAKGTARTFLDVWPLLLLAFAIAGFMRVVIPGELISSALGPTSGLKGILIGWGAGAFMPGAPYSMLPVAASLLASGASIGPVMTMVLSAGIGVAITRIPHEIAFVGWRFSALRIVVCILVPPIAGVAAQWIAKWTGLFPASGIR